RMGRMEVALVVTSLLGIVLVAQPVALFGGTAGARASVVLVALAGAVCSAVAYVIVRHLRTTEDPLVIVFYFPLVAVPATLPLMTGHAVRPRGAAWLGLLGVGLSTQVAQVFMTRGLFRLPAGAATGISYLQVAFAFVFGALLFGEHPLALGVLGALTIVASTLGIAWARNRRAAQQAATPAPTPTEGRS